VRDLSGLISLEEAEARAGTANDVARVAEEAEAAAAPEAEATPEPEK
jgi:hypothetical protein